MAASRSGGVAIPVPIATQPEDAREDQDPGKDRPEIPGGKGGEGRKFWEPKRSRDSGSRQRYDSSR